MSARGSSGSRARMRNRGTGRKKERLIERRRWKTRRGHEKAQGGSRIKWSIREELRSTADPLSTGKVILYSPLGLVPTVCCRDVTSPVGCSTFCLASLNVYVILIGHSARGSRGEVGSGCPAKTSATEYNVIGEYNHDHVLANIPRKSASRECRLRKEVDPYP